MSCYFKNNSKLQLLFEKEISSLVTLFCQKSPKDVQSLCQIINSLSIETRLHLFKALSEKLGVKHENLQQYYRKSFQKQLFRPITEQESEYIKQQSKQLFFMGLSYKEALKALEPVFNQQVFRYEYIEIVRSQFRTLTEQQFGPVSADQKDLFVNLFADEVKIRTKNVNITKETLLGEYHRMSLADKQGLSKQIAVKLKRSMSSVQYLIRTYQKQFLE
ncbi:Hypothetical_protein [Hexamita inflata]|uniref:Hypothetical_protein n=1 Tax=Hexamita inflata TaxID=28002 RepID=A0AA86TVU2_9EUKA|nr:Hypothetical protein HINF_LOCUS16712 [Hexamita inflata]